MSYPTSAFCDECGKPLQLAPRGPGYLGCLEHPNAEVVYVRRPICRCGFMMLPKGRGAYPYACEAQSVYPEAYIFEGCPGDPDNDEPEEHSYWEYVPVAVGV
jgi:hypothetical protein